MCGRKSLRWYVLYRSTLKREKENVTRVQSSLKEWHERLAHQNIQHVKTVLKNNITVTDNMDVKCESCMECKIHRLTFSISEKKNYQAMRSYT